MKKYKLGITFGAFELFHIGHLNLIKNAKKRCCKLIICVSNDEYIIKIKKHKPVTLLSDRLEIIKALKYVDIVDVQSLKFTKKDAIKKYKPNVIFVGNDWTPKTFSGEKLGIPVIYLPRTKNICSTKIRNKLINSK